MNAVYTEQGSINVVDAPFPHNADSYAVFAGDAVSPEGITKGAFLNWLFRSGTPIRLIDTDDVIIGGQSLIPPDASFIPLSEFNSGDVVFFGNSAFVAHVVTDIEVLDVSANYNATFTAGSPASLTQPVATPAVPFTLGFDVAFDGASVSGGGALQVSLDGTLLDTIGASQAGVIQPISIDVTDGGHGGLSAADLTFLYDGPTGSTMTLDNVSIPGSDLLNGDFGTQSLAAWGTGGAGAVGATLVPEPTTALLLVMATASAARRRNR